MDGNEIIERMKGFGLKGVRDVSTHFFIKPDLLAEFVQSEILAEREACARVCDAEADSMEQAAQRAIENGEHDEVSAIRSTAWKLSVAANRIMARSNAELTGRASAACEGPR